MKKFIYKLSVIAGLGLMLTACDKEFLDQPVYGLVAADEYFKTDQDLQEGVYAVMMFYNGLLQQIGTQCML